MVQERRAELGEPAALAEELDLVQVSDDGALRALVDEVVGRETDVVERYRGGNAGLLNALLGSVMKASRGKADPKAARELLLETLGPVGDG
mgnify:CR=1 FL=1